MLKFLKSLNPSASFFKTDHLVVIVFLTLITIKYPLFFIAPFPSGNFATGLFISSPDSLSAYALFMILFRYRELITLISDYNKLFLVSLASIFGVAVMQFCFWANLSYMDFFYAVFWISVPLAVCLYFETFKKYLVPYLALFWLFSMLHTIYQLAIDTQCVGISANRNWHGAFLISTTPFFGYWLYQFFQRKNFSDQKIKIIISSIAVFSLYALYMAESRGANLAFIIGVLLFLGLYLNFSPEKKEQQFGRIYLLTVSVFIIMGLIAGPLFFGQQLASMNSYDVRIPLWRGAIDMFAENLPLGVGPSGYEGHYAYYLPIERFFRSHYFAGRATHPHNQLLFFAGAYGIIGLLAIIFLWFAPIVIFLKNYRTSDTISKICFFSFLMLSIHAMFDLVMVRWPTMQISLILLGILWSYTFKKQPIQQEKAAVKQPLPFLPIKYFCSLTAYACLFFSIYLMYNNMVTSFFSRNSSIAASREEHSLTMSCINKAIDSGNRPDDFYNAGMKSLFWFGDYRLAYKYFSIFDNHPAKFVGYSNARIAECLIKMNRKPEALGYLDKHVKAFPLSSIALYNKLLLERELGRITDAEVTATRLINVMKLKGLKLEDMKEIIQNPEFDNRFHQLKEFKKIDPHNIN